MHCPEDIGHADSSRAPWRSRLRNPGRRRTTFPWPGFRNTARPCLGLREEYCMQLWRCPGSTGERRIRDGQVISTHLERCQALRGGTCATYSQTPSYRAVSWPCCPDPEGVIREMGSPVQPPTWTTRSVTAHYHVFHRTREKLPSDKPFRILTSRLFS